MAPSKDNTRRAFLKGIPAIAAVTVAPMAAAMVGNDPLVGLCRQYQSAHDALGVELQKPEAGNFDTPECLRIMAIKDRLEEQIKATPISTVAGAAALLDYAWIDCGAEAGDWVDFPTWVFARVREWSTQEASAFAA